MRGKYKGMAAVIAALMIFSSCAGTVNDEVSQTEQTSVISASVFTENTAEITAPETTAAFTAEEEQEPRTSDKLAWKYLYAMLHCEEFSELISSAARVQIVDMNSDGTPEIIVKLSAASHLAAVFSVDENGTAFYAAPADNSYSYDGRPCYTYDGDVLQLYTENGKSVFLTETYRGGSVSGISDIIEVSFDGKEVFSKAVGGHKYVYNYDTAEAYEPYYFGDKEKTLSEEEYNAALKEYTDGLEYSGDFSCIIRREDLDRAKGNPMKPVLNGLELFYIYTESADMLDESLPYNTERKLVSNRHWYYNNAEIEYYHSHCFDAAGNEIYYDSNYYAEGAYNRTGEYIYRYRYRPDGSVESYVRSHDGKSDTVSFDEHGNYRDGRKEYRYDDEGRLINYTWYTGDGGQTVYVYEKYAYDSEGRIAESEDFWVRGFYDNFTELQHDRYEYEKNRTLVYSTYEFSTEDGYEDIYGTEYVNGTEFLGREMLYDDNGNKTLDIIYASDGRKSVQYDYRYDKNGNMIYEERSVPDGLYEAKDSVQEYISTWSYDDNGNLLTSSYEYWGQKQFTSYEYDESGNVIREVLKITGEDNEMDGIYVGEYLTEYYYVFDFKGGIIKRETRGYARVDSLEKETPERHSEAYDYYQPVKVVIVDK